MEGTIQQAVDEPLAVANIDPDVRASWWHATDICLQNGHVSIVEQLLARDDVDFNDLPLSLYLITTSGREPPIARYEQGARAICSLPLLFCRSRKNALKRGTS